jgi:hypothetical protein
MAYPEPVPALKAKEAKSFEEKLDKFSLNSTQKEFYKKGRSLFK